METPAPVRYVTLFVLAILASACAPPIADDPDETDQVEDRNYVHTNNKDAWTQNLSLPAVDNLVKNAWVPSEAGPGCAVGLVEDGEVTYLQGYGMASLGDAGDPPAKWDYSTVAPVGSISKTITALSLRSLDLEWGNNLDIEDPVIEHLLTLAPLANQSLEDLLSHSTGLKRSVSWEDGSPPEICGPGEILSCDDVAWNMTHPRIAFYSYDDDVGALGAPQYSNLGFSVLGAVIDELTYDAFWLPLNTRGYEAYTWQRVGRYMSNDTYEGQMLSLALTHSWRVNEHDIPSYAHGYDLNGNLFEAWDDVDNLEGWEGPSGGWVMTIGDLSRLVAALMKGDILGANIINEMATSYEPDVLGGYGQGIIVDGQNLKYHGGDIGGHVAVWAWWPNATPKPFGVALMCNRADKDSLNSFDLLEVAKDIRSVYSNGGGTPQFTLPLAGTAAARDVDKAIFEIDLSTARITEPAGLYLPLNVSRRLWIDVVARGTDTLDLTLLVGDDPRGSEIKRMPLGTVPYKEGEPFRSDTLIDLAVGSTLGTVQARDLSFSAAFGDRGEYLTNILLGATVDARELVSMADEGWPKICRDLDRSGPQCIPCEDGNASCIRITAEWIGGPRNHKNLSIPR